MPTSSTEGKGWALEVYRSLKPATVVDIGAGEGTYAKLLRPHHKAAWTGIEAWAPYIQHYNLRELYDEIIVGDARHLDPAVYATDLVIIGDVLEHMTHAHARKLIARIQEHAANLLVSIPVLHLDQGAVNGNSFERHIDHWTYEGMRDALGPGVVDSRRGRILAYYHWAR